MFGAGTVIVSAGALQSPVMLLRAGIGPADHLTACGIPVVADRPGVGANLHNHQVLLLTAHLTRAALPPAGQRAHTTATWRYSSGIAHCPPSRHVHPAMSARPAGTRSAAACRR